MSAPAWVQEPLQKQVPVPLRGLPPSDGKLDSSGLPATLQDLKALCFPDGCLATKRHYCHKACAKTKPRGRGLGRVEIHRDGGAGREPGLWDSLVGSHPTLCLQIYGQGDPLAADAADVRGSSGLGTSCSRTAGLRAVFPGVAQGKGFKFGGTQR